MKAARNRLRPWAARCAAVMLALLTASCSHAINATLCHNPAQCNYDPSSGYRFHPEWKPNRKTLVIVTFSGGGTRAAALAYGAMQALAEIPGNQGSNSLLDDIDIVSSVSGGSVTAAWYALHGPAGFSKKGGQRLRDFLYTNGTSELAWRGLNPISLLRYLFTRYQRSDVLSDYFASSLFGEATYQDVLDQYKPHHHHGYVILNATDVGHEARFPFTQNNFDLLCSDLSSLKIADAVAASADFPLLFSAMGIRNFSPCPLQQKPPFITLGPLNWIGYYNKQFDTGPSSRPNTCAELPEPKDVVPMQAARLAQLYLSHQGEGPYLHLLDGGLADNLGIQSTLALSDMPSLTPGLALRLGNQRGPGYQNIQSVLYVVVNARTLDAASVDSSLYPPGPLASLNEVVSSGLGNASLDVQALLNAELQAATGRRPQLKSSAQSQCPPPPAVIPSQPSGIQPYVVSVDPEFILDHQCREWFWSLPTSWSLPRKTVDSLIALGRTLVLNSPGMQRYITSIQKPEPTIPDFRCACKQAWNPGP